MAGSKGARKSSRRNNKRNTPAPALASSVNAVPKPPSHSLINYDKFNDIEDSSEEEEEVQMPWMGQADDDGVSPHCTCAKCLAAQGLPVDQDPEVEVIHSTVHSPTKSAPGLANKSASSSFSFSKASGAAAKAKIAEGKAAHGAHLQTSTHRSSPHRTGSTTQGQRDAAYINLERLCKLQTEYISAYLDRKGHKLKIPDVLQMLDEYRGLVLGGHGHDESPDEAILRIFVDLQIKIDVADAPTIPVSLPTHMQAKQPKPTTIAAGAGLDRFTEVLLKHGIQCMNGIAAGDPSKMDWATEEPGAWEMPAAAQHVTSDDSDTSLSESESEDDDLPELMPFNAPGPAPAPKAAAAPEKGPAASTRAPPKAASTGAQASSASSVQIGRKEMLEAMKSKAAPLHVDDDEDMPDLYTSTESEHSAYDDEYDDDESVEDIPNLTPPFPFSSVNASETRNGSSFSFTPLSNPKKPDPPAKKAAPDQPPKSNAGLSSKPAHSSVPTSAQDSGSEPLFRTEPRSVLASVYGKAAADARAAEASGAGHEPFFGAFDRQAPKAKSKGAGGAGGATAAAESKAAKAQPVSKAPPSGFNAAAAIAGNAKPRTAAKAPGSDAAASSSSVQPEGSSVQGEEATPAAAKPTAAAAAKAAAPSQSRQDGAGFSAGTNQAEDAELRRFKEAVQKEKADRVMQELLDEEEREAAAAVAAKRDKQKGKKARRKANKEKQQAKTATAAPAKVPVAPTAVEKIEVDEVSDEEEEVEDLLDNQFSYLASNGVPRPSDVEDLLPDDSAEQAGDAPPEVPTDQDSLQMQMGGAFSLLQNMGKGSQEGSSTASASTSVPVVKPGQSPLPYMQAEHQAGSSSRQANRVAAYIQPRPVSAQRAMLRAFPPEHQGGIPHNALPVQQGFSQNGPQLPGVGPGVGPPPPPPPRAGSVKDSLVLAVAELGAAMQAGERTRLVAAIKQGTDTLFKAGTAPEHAAQTAELRTLLRDAKPRLKQLISRPSSATPTAQPGPQASKPPQQNQAPQQPPPPQQAQRAQHAQAPQHLRGPHFAPALLQGPGPAQQPQHATLRFSSPMSSAPSSSLPLQQASGPAAGRQQGPAARAMPGYGPIGPQPPRGPQPPGGPAPGFGPGMQRPAGPAYIQGQGPSFGARPAQNVPQQQGRPGQFQQPPPHAYSGHRPGFVRPPSALRPGIRPPHTPYMTAGHKGQQQLQQQQQMQQPPPPPPRGMAPTPQQQPHSFRPTLLPHLQHQHPAHAAAGPHARQSPQSRPPADGPHRQHVHVKAYQDEAAKFVQPAPYEASNKAAEVEDYDTDCIVCMDQVKNTVFIPCGHCLCCTACAEEVLKKNGKCPVCSTFIDSYCGTQFD